MGKMSFATKDASKGGFGIQEGNVEVINACAVVHQFPPNKKTGDQGPANCYIALDLQKLDKNLKPDGTDPERNYYTIGGAPFGESNLDTFHPGNAANADDADPEDLGDEDGVEGNCVNCLDESKFSDRCKWMTLVGSLEKLNFKPDILANGFFPDLIGLKGHIKTEKGEKFNADQEKDPTFQIFDRIFEFPYKAGGKSAPAGKPAVGKTAAAAPAAAPAKPGRRIAGGKQAPPPPEPEPEPEQEGDGEQTPEQAIAISTMEYLAGKHAGQTMTIVKLKSNAQTALIKGMVKGADGGKIDGKTQKAVLALLEDGEFLENEQFSQNSDGENVWVYDAETPDVTFA